MHHGGDWKRSRWYWATCIFLMSAAIFSLGGDAFSQQKPSATTPQPGLVMASPSMESESVPITYVNVCRVSGTPEEFEIDFGFTPMSEDIKPTVRVTHRIVMNSYNAKRLSNALQQMLQRYEEKFGVIELDHGKRAMHKPDQPK